MDKTAALSQGSISSINTVNQILDSHGSTGSASTTSEFINHGLLLWTQTRQRWVGNRSSDKQANQSREPKLNWNATYDSLLGSSKTFPQPIPLGNVRLSNRSTRHVKFWLSETSVNRCNIERQTN